MERDPVLTIIEYKNDVPSRSWEGIAACAKHHHISTRTLKWLLANGGPLYKDPSVSFDIDPGCPYAYVVREGSPVLVMDAVRAINGQKA